MKKKRLVRLQLVALALLALLLVWRAAQGPPPPEGALVFVDLEHGDLRHETIEVTQPLRLRIQATGAYADERSPGGEPALAAYAWVARHSDETPVWSMTDAALTQGDHQLAVADEVVDLAPGTYDVYFTALGPSPGRQGGDWTDAEEEWQVVLTYADESIGTGLRVDTDAPPVPQPDRLIWTSAPMESDARLEYLFNVDRPVDVHVEALGELTADQRYDYGWIERATTGQRVWEMRYEETTPVGGWAANRRYEATHTLEPGVYRAVFLTDGGHAYDDWRANPPYALHAWGLTLTAPDAGALAAVQTFDPWSLREPLVSIREVPNNTLRTATLTLTEPTTLIVYALGELTSEGKLYDYGVIENAETGNTVWSMSYDASKPAGGDDKNRAQVAFVRLMPGTYTARFQTDGSHAFGDFGSDAPDVPRRWGLTIFPLNADGVQEGTVAVEYAPDQRPVEVRDGAAPEVPAPPAPPAVTAVPESAPPVEPSQVIVQASRLGNESRITEAFELDERTQVRILAVGEITESDAYDYGWITSEATGERVWEMMRANTEPAGGDDSNRRFDGLLTLPAGRYTVHFRTDMSHAFDDFGSAAPADPNAWGITVARAQ